MLQQTLRTKVHLLQAPRISMVTSYTGFFHSSQIHRSQIRTFRSSTRLDTDDFAGFATKIDKLEGDVGGLKVDVSGLKVDVSGLKVDVSGLKGDVSGLKGDVSGLKGDVSGLKGDVSGLKEDVSDLKADIKELVPKLESTMKEQLGGYALNQEKQFSHFYYRSFFGILGVAMLLVGSSWIVPMNESKRLDSEIKRRAIIREGLEEASESKRLDSETKKHAVVPEGVEKASKGK